MRHLVKVADGLEAVICKCALQSNEGTVHRLRTGSRRVQATVETMLRQAGAPGKSLKKPAKAWLCSIKNIRRSAGPVRDLDVHRRLIERSFGQWETKAALQGPLDTRRTDGHDSANQARGAVGDFVQDANRLSSQAKKLDDRLKADRQARAETLKKKITKARMKFEQRRAAFQLEIQHAPTLRLTPRPSPGLVALEDFVRLVDAMPSLDSGNLHDFRKLTKKARYVAESGDEQSSQIVAKALKRVQDAIGEWHDWQCLAEEAQIALKQEGVELTAWLEGQAEHFLAAAFRISERVRGQLVGEWMAAKSERRAGNAASARKSPVRESRTDRTVRPRPTSGAA